MTLRFYLSNSHIRKHIIFFLFLVLVPVITDTTTPAFSQSWYIKPSAEIPIRRGQGTNFKILVVLANGTGVTLLEENDPWVKIQTKNGTEGWMLKRYLTQQPPLDRLVSDLRDKNKDLLQEEKSLKERISLLTTDTNELQSEFDNCLANLTATKNDYTLLQEETADVIAIKNNLEISTKKNKELTNQLETVMTENTTLKKTHQTKWFLAGAGTIILGWLIGLMSARSKKRRSSLY